MNNGLWSIVSTQLSIARCILCGAWDYDKLMLYAKCWDDAVKLRGSALPEQPNRKLVEQLAIEINYATIKGGDIC